MKINTLIIHKIKLIFSKIANFELNQLKPFDRRRKYQYNEDDFQLKFLIFTKLSISMDSQITWKQREAANAQLHFDFS